MATRAQPASAFHLSAEAIRDVCARPAAVAALAAGLPPAAVRSTADRRRAVADGVARALEAALAGPAAEALLLEEAERRMWEPVSAHLARVLHRTGPEGLFAYLVVEGAARREAWRADTARRRAAPDDRLAADAVDHDEREPLDLDRFRIEVERSIAATARRTGLAEDLVYDVLTGGLSYAEAGRRTGRSPNALWMALARLRPDWQRVAERGRAAGLGGGVLVRVADEAHATVRRAIRWRLVGGTTAVALLAGSLAGVAIAGHLGGGGARTAAPAEEIAPPPAEDPYGPFGRILALEAARRIAAATAPSDPAPRAGGRSTASAGGAEGAAPAAPAARPDAAVDAGPAAAATTAPAPSCGLGTAALSCR